MANENAVNDINYRHVLVRLLQGSLQTNDGVVWNTLLVNQSRVEKYFSEIGLNLHLNEMDGYAFLSTRSTQPEISDVLIESDDWSSSVVDSDSGKEEKIPSIIRKIPLSASVTLLLLLLREAMYHFDREVLDDQLLVITKDEMRQMLLPYYEEMSDNTKLDRRIDGVINAVEKLTFISEIKKNSGRFEIKRIIKSMIDASVVESMLSTLKSYLASEDTQESGEL